MSVKIRLRRVGAKKQPSYRIVVADARAPRDGRFIEILGYYNPLDEPATVVVDQERAQYWIKNGAQPTDVVVRLLKVAQSAPVAAPEVAAAPAPVVEEAAPVAEAAAPVEETAAPAEEAPAAE